MVVGLATEETTLTLLGGVGVLISLIQTNKTGFQSQFFPQGIDLVQKGSLSFGINPFGNVGVSPNFNSTLRPTPYLVATFKF